MKSAARSVPVLAFMVLCIGALAAAVAAAARGAPARGVPPVSLLDIMRAAVEIPADGIWAAEGNDKMTDEDWRLADQDSVNLIVASSLVARGGTGKRDAKHAAAADWQKWSRDMLKTSKQIRAAVKSTDPKAMAVAADHLQEICEACHTKYRPQTPSDGVSRYPFYPKRELIR